MKRRWPVVLFVALVLVFAGALIVALISARSISGAVPGKEPVLSLGVTDKGYAVGTTRGMWISNDASHWHKYKRFQDHRVLIASVTGTVFISSEGVAEKSSDLGSFEPATGAVMNAAAIATDSFGDLFLADGSHVALSTVDSGLQSIPIVRGPKEVIALAASPGETVTVYAGGLTSGMWRSIDGALHWRQILRTPTRALMVDPVDARRVFLGTSGGLLISTNNGVRWRFTDMRLKVEAIAAKRGEYYVLTDDRLIYRSKDGVSDWKLAARS